jgi:hypothetical protein
MTDRSMLQWSEDINLVGKDGGKAPGVDPAA